MTRPRSQSGRPRELDQIFGPEPQREYWARLDDLAHDLVELLENMADPVPEVSGDRSPVDAAAATPAAASAETSTKGTIYLAPTTYDLKEDRNDPTAVGTQEMAAAICAKLQG